MPSTRAPLRAGARSGQGVTLIEVAIILVVTFAIIGALAPTLSAVIRHAEETAATAAMTKIRSAILDFMTDTTFTLFTINGLKTGTRVNLLVSDGDIPRECSATSAACTAWQATVDNTGGLTDFLARHLVFNEPRGSTANAYSTTEVVADVFWKGTYLTAPIDPDPWGNRYMVNVQFLGASTNDVVVLSAGPDEEIDTEFTANPVTAGGDDLIVLVEA